jgi:uncharacterized membrane protein YgcG
MGLFKWVKSWFVTEPTVSKDLSKHYWDNEFHKVQPMTGPTGQIFKMKPQATLNIPPPSKINPIRYDQRRTAYQDYPGWKVTKKPANKKEEEERRRSDDDYVTPAIIGASLLWDSSSTSSPSVDTSSSSIDPGGGSFGGGGADGSW